MKKIIILFSILINAVVGVYGQSAKKGGDDLNCYFKWAQKFDLRGAEDVADGTYSDVIITFRSGNDAQCINGKCDVKDGKVTAMYTKMEDGSYEPIKRKLHAGCFPAPVTNGMSAVILTAENEIINVLFIKKIKPKKAGFEKAPDPSDD